MGLGHRDHEVLRELAREIVDMGLAAPEAAAAAEGRARDDADRHGWRSERLAGELLLVKGLIDGAWDVADYMVLQPGERLAMSYDEDVIRAEPASPG